MLSKQRFFESIPAEVVSAPEPIFPMLKRCIVHCSYVMHERHLSRAVSTAEPGRGLKEAS